jgi:hypothetical protein
LNKTYEAFEAHRRSMAQATPDMRRIDAIIAKPIPLAPQTQNESACDIKTNAITMSIPATKPINILLAPKKTGK